MDNNLKAKILLKRAKSNLIRGKNNSYLDLREIVLEDLCFDLQQCVEKSFKALLVNNNIDYPYTHKINILIELLEENAISIPDEIKEAVILTVFAVEARYDDILFLTEDIYKETLEISEKVYNWALEQIK